MAEMGDTIRVQNLNINQLSQLLNIELMPTVIQPDNLTQWSYPFPWNPLPLTSAKHFGYSFQWFAMSGVFLFITILIFIRWIRQPRSQGGEK
ncbi:SURF1 family protein [Vibrio harveyi]|nr:SURF1 family protein [Vibrio harveyi]